MINNRQVSINVWGMSQSSSSASEATPIAAMSTSDDEIFYLLRESDVKNMIKQLNNVLDNKK